MPKGSLMQTSFNGGELSPLMNGRIDLEKTRSGCQTLENFLPLLQGPAQKRPGTRYAATVRTSADQARLIPFEFNKDQAFILEFGDTHFRIYKDGALVESLGSPVEITTPYADDEIFDLKFAQSADVMYVTHPDYSPRKLSRLSDDVWELNLVEFSPPPFNDENTSTTTITSTNHSGTVTLTASAATFADTDVGGNVAVYETIESKHFIWVAGAAIVTNEYRHYNGNLYQHQGGGGTAGTRPPVHTQGSESDGNLSWNYVHSGFGWAEITGFTSTTVVTADVKSRLPESVVSGSVRWAMSSWSDTFGWAVAVEFFEDRLWFGGCANSPQTIWGSQSGNYEDFEVGVEASDSVSYTINSQKINPIQWLLSSDVLTVGTTGGEFVVSATSRNEAITPTNIKITRQTSYGTKENIRPFLVGASTVFVQRSGRVLREFNYSFEKEGYIAPSISEISEHLLSDGIIDMTYEQQPYRVLWLVTATGSLVGVTYEPEQQVLAWHSHDVGGVVESVATIPHWDGDQDVTFMVVKRTIDSAEVRYVEYLEKYLEGNTALFVDSGFTYNGASTTTITGLGHLEGEEVAILSDGYRQANKTVSSASITLDTAASVVNLGKSFTGTIKSMPLEGASRDGPSQGKLMKLTNLVVKLYNTGPGLKYGTELTDLDEFQMRDEGDLMDNPVPLYTGDTEKLSVPGKHDQSPALILTHDTPLPCTVVATMPQVTVSDR